MSDTRGAERWQIKLSDFAKECDYDVDKIRQQIQLGMKVTHSDMQMAVSGNWSQELFQLLLEEYKKAHTVTSLNLISHYICLSAYMVNPRVAKDRYFEQQTADEIHKNEEKYESLLLKLKSLLKAGSNFIGIEIKLVSSAGPEVLAILLESGYRLTEETLKEFIARYMSPPHWIDVLRERNLLTEELFKMSMSALCMSRDVELHAALGDLGSVQKYMLSTKVTEPFLFNLYAKMALQYAVLFQRYETAMLLLGMGAEANDEGYLLSMSVERCDVRMTRLLLSSPAIRLDVISHIGVHQAWKKNHCV